MLLLTFPSTVLSSLYKITFVFSVSHSFKCSFYLLLQNASAQAALQAAQALTTTTTTGSQNSTTPVSAPATPITNGQDIQGGPNTVLRVIIEHMIYPISLDILHVVIRNFISSYILLIPFLQSIFRYSSDLEKFLKS